MVYDVYCDGHISGTTCGMPLGMSTGEIQPLQITASSSEPPHWPHRARLNSPGGWCAASDDKSPTFMVGVLHMISFIILTDD